MSKPFNRPYRSLRSVRCDCERPALHQVPINAGGYVQWLALCPDCYAEFMADEATRRPRPTPAPVPQPA